MQTLSVTSVEHECVSWLQESDQSRATCIMTMLSVQAGRQWLEGFDMVCPPDPEEGHTRHDTASICYRPSSSDAAIKPCFARIAPFVEASQESNNQQVAESTLAIIQQLTHESRLCRELKKATLLEARLSAAHCRESVCQSADSWPDALEWTNQANFNGALQNMCMRRTAARALTPPRRTTSLNKTYVGDAEHCHEWD
eukprot:4729434-Amphidinium_carterae.1